LAARNAFGKDGVPADCSVSQGRAVRVDFTDEAGAISIPSNIAEGQARRGAKEFAQFLSLASGSFAELETQLLLSVDLGYVKPLDLTAVLQEVGEIQRMVSAIRRKLTSWFPANCGI
jgi:four helix bundle protein